MKSFCSDWRFAAIIALTATATAVASLTYRSKVNAELANPPVTWTKAWLVPDHASRADVLHGVQPAKSLVQILDDEGVGHWSKPSPALQTISCAGARKLPRGSP